MENPNYHSDEGREVVPNTICDDCFLVADQKCSTREPLRINLFHCVDSTWQISAVGIMPEIKSNYASLSVLWKEDEGEKNLEMFIIGGMKNGQALKTVEVFNKRRNLRRPAAPLLNVRTRPCAVVHNNQIHVAGGYNGVYLKSVEIYDRTENKWLLGPELQKERADAALISCEGELFVLGGYNGTSYVSQIEKLNKTTQIFEIIAEMPNPRAGFGACNFRGKIWIAGGWSSSGNTLNAVMSFDPKNCKWKDEKPMETERKYFSLIATSNEIWAVRGNSANWSIIKSCEKLALSKENRVHKIIKKNKVGPISKSDRLHLEKTNKEENLCNCATISLFGFIDISFKLRGQ